MQIYLTSDEIKGIRSVAATTGRKKSEVIREAIDQYLQRFALQDSLGKLRAAQGILKDRKISTSGSFGKNSTGNLEHGKNVSRGYQSSTLTRMFL